DRFKHLSLPLNDLQSFTRFPFTRSCHIKTQGPRFLAVPQDEISRVVTLETSGTTGRPKRLFFTDQDLEKTIVFFTQVLAKLTRPKDRLVILLPGQTPASAGDLLKTAAARIHCQAHVPGLVTDHGPILDLIAAQNPRVIIGLPVQVLALAERMAQKQICPTSLAHVILTSDRVSPAIKNRIAKLLNSRVFDHYGMTETCFGGAIDCCAHQGYHLRETDLYYEIIDTGTQRPAPKGHWGQVVVTTLNCQGMPLIRYQTGDVSRFIPGPCDCGSPFRRMDYIQCRKKNNQFTTQGLAPSFTMAVLDDIIFKNPYILDFQAYLCPDKSQKLSLEIMALNPSKIDTMTLTQDLKNDPGMSKLLKEFGLIIGPITVAPFYFTNTFQGKRQIQFVCPRENTSNTD
ncbi:MAG: phenylacetate--CoA ligase family protein, partial [Desulfobacteraceae bacterium]|nr:phenylacetate--CoA ligase family protein [Desulfobacteraceae bacterium]